MTSNYYFLKIFVFILILSSALIHVEMQEDLLNTIQFPFGGPFMGLFVTLSIPLGLKEEDIFLGYNMEANYVLPENQTSLTYPPLLAERAITRYSVYQFLSSKISRFGYPGYECLLRLICDVALHPIKISNGVLGDLLHIFLTPSSSSDVDYIEAYREAERVGAEEENCSIYHYNCSLSVLDLFTIVSDIIE